MVLSCDNWCHFHISLTQVDDGLQCLHRVATAERTPRRGRPVGCHSIRMRSVYEIPVYVAEETLVTEVSECEHRKVISMKQSDVASRNRFFVEIRQTPDSPIETFGFAVPQGKSTTSHETCRPLNPFPSDADVLCYIASHRDLMDAFGVNPKRGREHYRNHGRKEGRTITFEPLRYVASHVDLFQFGTDRTAACKHYILHGRREVRPVTFDPFCYLAGYPDLLEKIPPREDRIVDHYIKTGWAEGRNCYAFSWRDYLRLNPDLDDELEYSPQAAAEHFVLKGYAEKRKVA